MWNRLPGNWRSVAALIAAVWLLAWLSATVISAAPDTLDDREVTLAVEAELRAHDEVPAHRIDVSAERGEVTLQGKINSYRAKTLAGRWAETVKGVVAVNNQIQVVPPDRPDTEIAAQIASKLARDPVTESFQIDVQVNGGKVTLAGNVDSYAEKQIAERIAEEVRGVVSVQNDLGYEVVGERSDDDIQEAVEYRLRADGRIESGTIAVLVNDGQVALQGSVRSAAEKREAESEAWMVPGVTSVINQLEVQWWREVERRDGDAAWDDAHRAEAVKRSLISDPRVNSFNVNVSVRSGVATLTGAVANLRAKWAAEQKASDILGIRRVKNHLRVRPPLYRTDMEIARDVRDVLRQEPLVSDQEVGIKVNDGKVYLRGVVDTRFQRIHAEFVAAGVDGVVEVQNGLDVNYAPTALTDREIREDILGQLYWSPLVNEDTIRVQVIGGVATLFGTVEDWDQHDAACRNAREGGATAVVSKLEVANE